MPEPLKKNEAVSPIFLIVDLNLKKVKSRQYTSVLQLPGHRFDKNQQLHFRLKEAAALFQTMV